MILDFLLNHNILLFEFDLLFVRIGLGDRLVQAIESKKFTV